jgi:hypothetical protein
MDGYARLHQLLRWDKRIALYSCLKASEFTAKAPGRPLYTTHEKRRSRGKRLLLYVAGGWGRNVILAVLILVCQSEIGVVYDSDRFQRRG